MRFSARGRRGMLEGSALLRRMEAELSARLASGDMERLHGILVRLLAALEASPPVSEAAATRATSRSARRRGSATRR